MKICYNQGCNDIGVDIATKRRYYLFYLQQYISTLGTVRGSFFLQQRPQCSLSLSKICKSVFEIFWDEVFMVRNAVKNGQS